MVSGVQSGAFPGQGPVAVETTRVLSDTPTVRDEIKKSSADKAQSARWLVGVGTYGTLVAAAGLAAALVLMSNPITAAVVAGVVLATSLALAITGIVLAAKHSKSPGLDIAEPMGIAFGCAAITVLLIAIAIGWAILSKGGGGGGGPSFGGGGGWGGGYRSGFMDGYILSSWAWSPPHVCCGSNVYIYTPGTTPKVYHVDLRGLTPQNTQKHISEEIEHAKNMLEQRQNKEDVHDIRGQELLQNVIRHELSDSKHLSKAEVRAVYEEAHWKANRNNFRDAADMLWVVEKHKPDQFNPLDEAQVVSDLAFLESKKKGDPLSLAKHMFDKVQTAKTPAEFMQITTAASALHDLGVKEKNKEYQRCAQSILSLNYQLIYQQHQSDDYKRAGAEMAQLLESWK